MVARCRPATGDHRNEPAEHSAAAGARVARIGVRDRRGPEWVRLTLALGVLVEDARRGDDGGPVNRT